MNDDDDLSANAAWQAYQSSIGDKYRDTLTKAIYETKLDASGLLLDKEIKKISDKVEKDKLLDDLFNPDASMAVTSQQRTHKIFGKQANVVVYDDPWDI